MANFVKARAGSDVIADYPRRSQQGARRERGLEVPQE